MELQAPSVEDKVEHNLFTIGSENRYSTMVTCPCVVQLNLFKDSEKPGKNLFKAKTPEVCFEALKPIVSELEVLEDARFGWEKPL